MKRIVLAAALAVSVFCSCKRDMVGNDPVPEGGGGKVKGTGTISMTIGGCAEGTDASTNSDWESSVNGIEVLLFCNRTDPPYTYCYHSATPEEVASRYITLNNIVSGTTYTMYVFANLSDSLNIEDVADKKEADDIILNLADNKIGTCFQMSASVPDISIREKEVVSVEAGLERMPARVILSKVVNKLHGDTLKIENVFLSNVPDKSHPFGTVKSWINRQGRVDEVPRVYDHIIDGSKHLASQPDFTFRTIDAAVPKDSSFTAVQCLYGCGNDAVARPSGFTSVFPSDGEKTCLVLTASFGGRRYYYPVVIDDFKGNTTYEYIITIRDKGSDDPNIPVVSGAFQCSVTVKDWTAKHHEYDENI